MKQTAFALYIFVVLLFSAQNALAWGSTGHRAIAEIAQDQLTRKSKKKLKTILGANYLPLFATWADEIRSEHNNPLGNLPHYVNMPFDVAYESSIKSANGDLVTVFNQMVAQFKSSESTTEEKATALKFIIHLVGDVHQPMHIGLADDLGGNKVDVKWFGETSNLHKVWDEEMIDYSRLSYIELARFANLLSPAPEKQFLNTTNTNWVDESQALTKLIYNNLDNKEFRYEYYYQFNPVVLQQIQKAGFRLGNVLNELLR